MLDREESKIAMKKAEHKSFEIPDETRKFENGKDDFISIGPGKVGRMALEPGWKWSNDVKPVVKTEWCEVPHFQYHASGKLHVKMQDGEEFEFAAGTVSYLPAG